MVLYHGSNMAVEQPDLNHSKTNLDFGAGFYTTSDLDQAKRWAVSTTRRRGTGEATVTVYRVNSTLWRPMAVQRFTSPNKAWLEYITVNRKHLPDESAWDIVIGPVANDDTQQTIGIYLRKYRAIKVVSWRVNFSTDAIADFEGLLAVN